jgi:hypothetical protein
MPPYDPLLRQNRKGSTKVLPGGPPTGPASGDLSGTYPGPTVAKINGQPLGSTSPTAGNLLVGSGTAWVTQALSGDATLAASGVLTLASVISAGGPTGGATTVPVITYDAKGRLTAVSTASIVGPFPPNGAAGGDLSGTYPNPTVAKINGNPLGSTTPSAGRLLVGSGTAWVSVAMSGDAALAATGALTLATVNSSPGTFGDSTHIPVVTVNGKGLVTLVTTVSGSFPPSGTAGGDLGGTYPNPTVLSLAHVTTGVLTVPNGGTGDATLTAHGVLIGEGTSAVAATAAGTAGQLLVGQDASSDPSFRTMSGDATLAASGAITVDYAPVKGGSDTDPLNYWYMAEPADVGAVTVSSITSVTANTSGTITAYTDSTGIYTNHAGATSGTAVGWVSSAAVIDVQNLPKTWIKVKTGLNITSQRIWAGLFSSTTINNDTPGTTAANLGAAFRYSTVAGDTTWQCVTFNGTSQTVTDSGVTVAKDTRYDLVIDFVNYFAGTPSVRFYINSTLVATMTLTLPDGSTPLFLLTQIVPQVSVSRSLRIGKWHTKGQATRTAQSQASAFVVHGSSSMGSFTFNTTTAAMRTMGDPTFFGKATPPDTTVQTRQPITTTFTKITGLLNAAMAAGTGCDIRLNINGTGDTTMPLTIATAAAPTATLVATSSGNLTNGAYKYQVTFVINGYENAPSGFSGSVTVDATHKQITVSSIPTGPTGTTARKVYRTTAGGATALLQSTISDNTTTSITDNTADASLGAAAPTGLQVGSATGSVTVGQDDLVCFEAANFTGGATSVTYLNLVTAYTAAASDGFFMYDRFTAAINNFGWLTRGPSTGSTMWLPKATTIKVGTVTGSAAPGAGSSYTLQPKINGTAVGTAVSLSGTNTHAAGTVAAHLPLTTTAAAADGMSMQYGQTGSPTISTLLPMFSYRVDAPDTGICWHTAGQGAFAWTLDGTSRFPCFGFFASGTPSTIESSVQFQVPVAGTFKYMGCAFIVDSGTTARVVLRVNNADSALVLTCTGTGAQAWTSDLTTSVSVNANDLVCFEYHRTVGAGTTFPAQIIVGFTV